MIDFNQYFEFLMQWEGETYECDPDDLGGATKYGVDQRSHPELNVRTLTRAQAKAIYLKEFNASIAKSLRDPFCWIWYDLRVNAGEVRAIKVAQQALGVVADGQWGPKSKSAWDLAVHLEPIDLAGALLERRRQFYRQLAASKPSMGKFLKGWLNRTNSLQEFVGLKNI